MGVVKDILYIISNKQFLAAFKEQSIFPYYHIVRDDQVAHIENLYPFKNRKQFIDDITLLKKYYRPYTPQDILDNKSLKNHFLITFDDGLQEIYTVIFPILKEYQIKAVFFINPNFVDNTEGLYKHYISIIISHLKNKGFEKSTVDAIADILSFSYDSIDDFKKQFITIRYSDSEKIDAVLKLVGIDIKAYLKENQPYITKAQIQEMLDDGHYFGGHTMTHPPLNQLTHEQQKDEIIQSMEWLKKNFNIAYSLFAFPFSDKSISKKLLQELFEYDSNIKLFGNSGLKKDIDNRIIQRFSLEHPKKQTRKQIVTENLYKLFNKVIGKYHIKRK
jgi:peptidoglycan/xylan/chitin deacetylase (PgdA/CDA1 family)